MKIFSSLLREANRARERVLSGKASPEPIDEHQAELRDISERQEKLAASFTAPSIAGPLKALEEAAVAVGKAASGSWIGYQSRVYYEGLQPPPQGARFSPEWGLMDVYVRETVGDWREYDRDAVKAAVHELADNPDLQNIRNAVADAQRRFEADRASAISILTMPAADAYLEKLKQDIEKLSFLSETEILQAIGPSGQMMTRDSVAMNAGLLAPPHMEVFAAVIAQRQPEHLCRQLGDCARAASEHLSRKVARTAKVERAGTHIFIGHGRSPMWRELKDFLQEKLYLPVDEFNRVPVAGRTNIERLSQMLGSAAFAFLIMSGEDETPEGTLRARMNVVHEAGLFQGKLGFARAIVLLEEGCETFSNIEGLGHISFPKGNIKAAFQEIREVLEREDILEA